MQIRERIRQKFHTKKGFTLAETLLAVLILLMVSSIVASGIPVAKNAYEEVVLVSNAEVLLSTTISTLRNELGTALEIDVLDANAEGIGTRITYYSGLRSASSQIYLNSDDEKEVMFQRYYKLDGMSAEYDAAPLMPEKTSTEELYVTYSGVKYSGGIVTFLDLQVMRASTNDGLTQEQDLPIRVISYEN